MHKTLESGVSRPALKPAASRLQFTSAERRDIFRGMVVGELEAGFLRYSKRQALLRYAGLLGLSEFEASLLIAEAQYRAGEIQPIGFDSVASLATVSRPEEWSIPLRISFALVAAMFLDIAALWWLFG